MEKYKKTLIYLVFVLPALAVYLVIIAVPIISSVGLSFTDYNIYKNTAIWTGFVNYIKILTDPIFWFSMRNNLIVILVSIFGQIPLGFGLAYLIYRKLVKRSGFFQAMVFLPTVISTIIILTVLIFIIRSNRVYFPPSVSDEDREKMKMIPEEECPCWDSIREECLPQSDCI